MRKFNFELSLSNSNINFERIKRSFILNGPNIDPCFNLIESEDYQNLRNWNLEPGAYTKITSPVREANEKNVFQLKNIIDSIRRDIRGHNVIDRRCELIINIDINDFSDSEIRNLLMILYVFEKCFFLLNPPSRYNERNPRPLQLESYESYKRFNPSDPYYTHSVYNPLNSVNLYNFHLNGTIQFRYCSGTIRGNKIMGWIRLFLNIIEIVHNNYEINIPKNYKNISINDLVNFINNHSSKCQWLIDQKERCNKWIINRRKNIIKRNGD